MTTIAPALLGGVLIGLSAVLLLWLNGRVAGVSGIVSGLWFSARGEWLWRLMFLLGLMLGAGAWFGLGTPAAAPRVHFPVALLIGSGLLVGYGTALSGGCTSGHGVCGLARLSPRSIAATAVFVAVAIVTTFVVRHLFHIH